MASVERRDNPLILKLNFSLPPGTEIIDGYEGKPRLPRPAPTPSRPVPEWPPCDARVGHWIAKYLDQVCVHRSRDDSETKPTLPPRIFIIASSVVLNETL